MQGSTFDDEENHQKKSKETKSKPEIVQADTNKSHSGLTEPLLASQIEEAKVEKIKTNMTGQGSYEPVGAINDSPKNNVDEEQPMLPAQRKDL